MYGTHQGVQVAAGIHSVFESQFNHCGQSKNNSLHILLSPHGTSQLPQSIYIAPPMRLHFCSSPQAVVHHCLTEASAGRRPQHALAVRAVPQPQQGPAALSAGPQMVCGVDNLDAQVQRLQEDSRGQEGARESSHHQFRIRAKRSRVLPSSSYTLLGHWGATASQQAAVRERKEAAVEHRHHVVNCGVRAKDVKRHVQEQLPHRALGTARKSRELWLQHRQGGVTSVAQHQVKGLCKKEWDRVTVRPSSESSKISFSDALIITTITSKFSANRHQLNSKTWNTQTEAFPQTKILSLTIKARENFPRAASRSLFPTFSPFVVFL